MKKIIYSIMTVGLLALSSCQDMNHPALNDYARDSYPAGGPLKFYVAFDGTTTNPLMNAVDSIRATFPTLNTTTITDGIKGKAMQGADTKFVKFAKPSDFATTAKSFTIAFWEKHNGQTQCAGSPGAEHIFSFQSNNGHWSGGNMFLLFDAGPTASDAAIKFVIVDKNMNDTWLNWDGANSISGLLDNQWHHLAFVYDAGTSVMTLYKDGTAIGTKSWAGHGNVNLDANSITQFRIGNGPGDTANDWLNSCWKGALDQFRMYASALTASEVQSLFAGKK